MHDRREHHHCGDVPVATIDGAHHRPAGRDTALPHQGADGLCRLYVCMVVAGAGSDRGGSGWIPPLDGGPQKPAQD